MNINEGGKFSILKRKFNNRSHAEQELNKLEEKGIITTYIISWNTQLRMVVKVVYKDSRCKKHSVPYDYCNGQPICPICNK